MNKQEREKLIREKRAKVNRNLVRARKRKSDEERYDFALKELRKGKSVFAKRNSDKITNK